MEAQEANATGLDFENSQWTLKGQVRITMPDGKLASDSATVTFRDNQIVRAQVRGTPATFEQRLKENRQLAQGRARDIEYDVRNGTVQLAGDAWLSDGQNEIRGQKLVYDIGKQRVAANPGATEAGGVRITINPEADAGHQGAGDAGRDAGTMSQLRAESLGKSYRKRQVVANLSLEVASGEVVGLLGPNGAGKTTAFYMIVGLVPCDAGRIWLDDRELTDLPMHRRARLGLGYLPQEASVFRKLTVEDNILAILETREDLDEASERHAALESLLEELHIGHIRSKRRLEPVGRRAAARRDRARAGGRAALHPARRAVRRRRPDLGGRHPAHHPPPEQPQHRRADHRPQRPRNARHLQSCLYRQRRKCDRVGVCRGDSCQSSGA